jgi:hypothetical protein
VRRAQAANKRPLLEFLPQLAQPRGQPFGTLNRRLGAKALGLGANSLGLGATIRGFGATALGLALFEELDVSQKGLSIGSDDSQVV